MCRSLLTMPVICIIYGCWGGAQRDTSRVTAPSSIVQAPTPLMQPMKDSNISQGLHSGIKHSSARNNLVVNRNVECG
jgi:hypothetical protein